MQSLIVLLRVLATTILLFVGGCAPAYHSYSECRVNCRYCPPRPLAYPHYCDCQCHSCQAQPYLATRPELPKST